MEPDAYRLMSSHEDHHWWFVGRRAVISAMLERIPRPPSAKVLEAGCGTGGNLYLLSQRGEVSAFEPHDEARDLAKAKYPDQAIHDGELPFGIPFEPGTFDLVVALDVLEHVEEDEAALLALVAMAKPGGRILVTVPAIQILWGSHDRRLHHVRRYDAARLKRICKASGASTEFLTYFNTLLAPIAIAYRLGERFSGRNLGNQERTPPVAINRVLAGTFSLERQVVRRRSIPFGLSLGVILVKD
jgi:SAM-dependent methyltransferase